MIIKEMIGIGGIYCKRLVFGYLDIRPFLTHNNRR